MRARFTLLLLWMPVLAVACPLNSVQTLDQGLLSSLHSEIEGIGFEPGVVVSEAEASILCPAEMEGVLLEMLQVGGQLAQITLHRHGAKPQLEQWLYEHWIDRQTRRQLKVGESWDPNHYFSFTRGNWVVRYHRVAVPGQSTIQEQVEISHPERLQQREVELLKREGRE